MPEEVVQKEKTPLLGAQRSKPKRPARRPIRQRSPQDHPEKDYGTNVVELDQEVVQNRLINKEKRPHSRRFRTLPHSAPATPRFVTSVCTAKEYKMDELKRYFEARGRDVIDSEEVLFTRYEASKASSDEPAWVFFFQYGVVVWWGPSDSWGKLMLLGLLKKFEVKPEESLDLEVCDYSYREDQTETESELEGTESKRGAYRNSVIWNDHFILGDRSWEVKLAFSHGLAQSAKLTVFEERIDSVIEETRRYPEYLAEHGKVKLTRKEIAKLKGRLFLHRMDINLHSDILDTPDFFWEHTELEPLYFKCRNYMEINKRVEILNQRLDVVHELFSMLSDELNQKHNAKLEWIIIWLILIEVVVGLVSIAMSFLHPIHSDPR